MPNRSKAPVRITFFAIVSLSLIIPACSKHPLSNELAEVEHLIEQKKHEDALILLKQAESTGIQNGRLFYNLGLLHFRMSDYANAILYMEKAEKWNISKKKTRYILDKSRLELNLQWKVNSNQNGFHQINHLNEGLPSFAWFIFSIAVMLMASLTFYLQRKNSRSKIKSFSNILLPSLSGFLFIFGCVQWNHEYDSKEAIIVGEDATLIIAPEEGSEVLRIVPMGTKVLTKEKLADYLLVVLPNLEEGWIHPSQIKLI